MAAFSTSIAVQLDSDVRRGGGVCVVLSVCLDILLSTWGWQVRMGQKALGLLVGGRR